MKTSPNREQQLFLVAGGTILLLILGVVIFNMVQPPGKGTREETITPRPVVVLDSRPNGTTKKHTDSPWFSSVSPARIFTEGDKNGSGPRHSTADAVSSRAIKKPVETTSGQDRRGTIGSMDRVGEGWTPNAGDLETARIASARERKKSLQLNVPRIDANKIGQNRITSDKPSISDRLQKSEPTPPQRTTRKPLPTRAKKKPPPVRITDEKPLALAKKPSRSRFTPAPARPTTTERRPVLANKKRPVPAERPATPKRGYSVQVASFSSAGNARALAQRLGALPFEGGKLPVYRSSVTVAGGKTYHRVRVGPFQDRNQAQRAAGFVRRSANLSGTVMPPGR